MKNAVLFDYSLRSAWGSQLWKITITDKSFDNVVIDETTDVLNPKKSSFTLPKEELEKVRAITGSDDIFEMGEITFPPVLQGTEHMILLSDGKREKKVICYNLWYFKEREADATAVKPNADAQLLLDKLYALDGLLQNDIKTGLQLG